MPAPADEVVLGYVFMKFRERPMPVALGIFELLADRAERHALPRHLAGRELPARMARDAGVRRRRQSQVVLAMARSAIRAGRAHVFRSARDGRHVRVLVIALQRMIASRMAIDTARMLDHLAGFAKQRDRALTAVLNGRKRGSRPQLRRSLLGLRRNNGFYQHND